MKKKSLKQDGGEAEEFSLGALRSSLSINRADLDGEVTKHPELVAQVGEQWVRAVSRRDGLKDGLKRHEAELRLLARDRAKKRDVKATAAEIEAEIETHATTVNLKRQIRMQSEIADLLEALWDAFKARGYALRELAQFELARMHGSPFVKDEEAERRRLLMDKKRRSRE